MTFQAIIHQHVRMGLEDDARVRVALAPPAVEGTGAVQESVQGSVALEG